MKRKTGIAAILAVIFVLLSAVVGCDFTLRLTTVVRLEADLSEVRTAFLEGEAFSSEGLRVTAFYSDSTSRLTEAFHVVKPQMQLSEEERAAGLDTVTRNVGIVYGTEAETSYEVTLAAFKGIALDESGVRRQFALGERFEAEGLRVFECYGDGTRLPLENGAFSLSTPDMGATGDAEVTVSYEKFGQTWSASYTIEIGEAKTLGIAIDPASAMPTHFFEGEAFNCDGLLIDLVTTNGNVPLREGFTVSVDNNFLEDGKLLAGTGIVVTVSYLGFPAITYTIDVEEVRLRGITINESALEKHFFAGKPLTYDGLVVMAHYTDGSARAVQGYSVLADHLDLNGDLTLDSKTVTVTYTENGATMSATYPIEVEKIVPERITLNEEQLDRNFVEGFPLKYEGLVVTAHYSDGSARPVGGYTVSVNFTDENGALTLRSDTVTVVYSEADVTVSAAYSIEVAAAWVQRLFIDYRNAQRVFDVGDPFTAEGIIVTLEWVNGKTRQAEEGEYTVTPPDMTSAGMKSVTVTSGAAQDAYSIEVYDRLTGLLITDRIENYFEGMTFERSMLEVRAVYNGDEAAAERISDYTLGGIEEGEPLEAKEYVLTFSYSAVGAMRRGEVKETYTLTPAAVRVIALELDASALAGRRYYMKQASYDFSGLKVTLRFNYGAPATYIMGTEEADALFEAEFSGEDSRALTVTVSLRADPAISSLFTLPLEPALEAITVSGMDRTTLVFTAGEEFRRENITVSAQYSDGHFLDVTEQATFSVPTMSEVGPQKVTVTFENAETSYRILILPNVPPETHALALSGGLILYVTERSGMPSDLQNGAAAGWLWLEERYALTPFSYTYTAVGTHAFEAEGLTAETDGDLILHFCGGTFSADEANWKRTVCGWRPVSRFTVDPALAPTVFEKGEAFSSAGLRLSAVYADGGEGTIDDPSLFTVHAPDTNTLGAVSVPVTYLGVTAAYSVKVRALHALRIEGNRTSFVEGEAFSLEGVRLFAVYDLGSAFEEEELPEGEGRYVFDREIDVRSLPVGTFSVTFSYRTVTASYTVTVEPRKPAVTGAELHAEEARREYFVGDALEELHIFVTVRFDNGAEAEAEIIAVTCDPAHYGGGKFIAEGQAIVTVKAEYEGESLPDLTYTVTVLRVVAVLLTVERTVYTQGEIFLPPQAAVRLFDGETQSERPLPAELLPAADLSVCGEQTLTLTYYGESASLRIFVLPASPVDVVEAHGTRTDALLRIYASVWLEGGSESFLFFRTEEEMRLFGLKTSANGMDARFETGEDGPTFSISETGELTLAFAGDTFVLSAVDWRWTLLGERLETLAVRFLTSPEFVGVPRWEETIEVTGSSSRGSIVVPPSSFAVSGAGGEVGKHTALVTLTHGAEGYTVSRSASFDYIILPDVGEEGKLALNATVDGSCVLYLEDKPDMPYGDADASATGWILARTAEGTAFAEFTYLYRADSREHTFEADGFTLFVDGEGTLTVSAGEFFAPKAMWQKFVCGWREIGSLSAVGGPRVFDEGSDFSAEGLVLEVRYTEGDPEEYTEHFRILPPTEEEMRTAGNHLVTLYFCGESVSYEITVRALTLLRIEGNETHFETGDAFTAACVGTVTAVYSNGDEEPVSPNDNVQAGFRFELEEGALSGGKLNRGTWSVTVRFRSLTATYQIVVEDAVVRTLVGLSLDTSRVQKEYEMEGNTVPAFTSEGLTVEAIYTTDPTHVRVAPQTAGENGYTVDSHAFKNSPGHYTIFVSFTEGGVTVTESFEVVVICFIGLAFDVRDAEVVQTAGARFDDRGIVVMAQYQDGTAEGIAMAVASGEYALTAPDMSVVGEQTVTAVYKNALAEARFCILPARLYENGSDRIYRLDPSDSPDTGFVSTDTAYADAALTLYMTEIRNGIYTQRGTYSYGWLLFGLGGNSYRLQPFEVMYYDGGAGNDAFFPLNEATEVEAAVEGESLRVSGLGRTFIAGACWQKVVLDYTEEGGLAVDPSGISRIYSVGETLQLGRLALYTATNRRTGANYRAMETPGNLRLFDPSGTIVEDGESSPLEREGRYTLEYSAEVESEAGESISACARFDVLVLPEAYAWYLTEEGGGFEAIPKLTATSTHPYNQLYLLCTLRGETEVSGYFVLHKGEGGGLLDGYGLYAFTARMGEDGNWTFACSGAICRAMDDLEVTVDGIRYTFPLWRSSLDELQF